MAQSAQVLSCNRLSVQQPNSDSALVLLAPQRPILSSFGLNITPPPATFLQASLEGETALNQFIATCLDSTKKSASHHQVIDLFCGSGTLSAHLLKQGLHVLACDEDGQAIAAYENAAHQAGFGQQARFERRNLYSAPLLAEELNHADYVILDPPRNGAEAQVRLISESTVNQLIMVSCNPRSFVRDLAILVHKGSYQIDRLQLIDQFVYSTHIEMVASLSRSAITVG